MYDWLSELPADGSVHVVTANRRLARALREVYAERQIAAGSKAWLSPEVRAVQDWYATLADKVDAKFARPIRINEQQSCGKNACVLRSAIRTSTLPCWPDCVAVPGNACTIGSCPSHGSGTPPRVRISSYSREWHCTMRSF
jgi:hypothetical protein